MRDTMRRFLLWFFRVFGGLGLVGGLLYGYLWALQALLSVFNVRWSMWQVVAATGLLWLALGPIIFMARQRDVEVRAKVKVGGAPFEVEDLTR